MLSDAYSTSAISERVSRIATSINKDYANEKCLHMIVTLNGSFMFAADLCRQINIPLVMHFTGSSSYFDNKTADEHINPEGLPKSFGNTPVLIIEDIMDKGATVKVLRQIIADRFASNIKVASLLKRQGAEGSTDYFGFTIPKGMFIVGYGMDMDGQFRELPDLKTISSAMASGVC